MSTETKAEREAQQAESLAYLRRILPPGSTVHTILRHRARSGMFRRISLVVATTDGKGNATVEDITWHAARAWGQPVKQRGKYVQDAGLAVGGCGMDMGFHLVNNLSYTVHGHKDKGRKAIEAGKAGRPFRATKTAFRSGYSLEHRWL